MSGLAPCPHCGVAMGGDDSYMIHPKNDCFWSGWEFDQPNVSAWNRRAPLPAEQPSNLVPPERKTNSSDPRDQAHAAGWNACREAMLKKRARIVGQQTKGGAA